MAHFAELNDQNTVLRVIVVSNEDCLNEEGIEDEAAGVKFCEELLGGRWKQTSYNSNIRGKYAAIGDIYDQELDEFVAPVQEAEVPLGATGAQQSSSGAQN